MTIKFTNEEHEYIYTDKDMKIRCKEDAPDNVKKDLQKRIEAFNKWVDEINGVTK